MSRRRLATTIVAACSVLTFGYRDEVTAEDRGWSEWQKIVRIVNSAGQEQAAVEWTTLSNPAVNRIYVHWRVSKSNMSQPLYKVVLNDHQFLCTTGEFATVGPRPKDTFADRIFFGDLAKSPTQSNSESGASARRHGCEDIVTPVFDSPSSVVLYRATSNGDLQPWSRLGPVEVVDKAREWQKIVRIVNSAGQERAAVEWKALGSSAFDRIQVRWQVSKSNMSQPLYKVVLNDHQFLCTTGEFATVGPRPKDTLADRIFFGDLAKSPTQSVRRSGAAVWRHKCEDIVTPVFDSPSSVVLYRATSNGDLQPWSRLGSVEIVGEALEGGAGTD